MVSFAAQAFGQVQVDTPTASDGIQPALSEASIGGNGLALTFDKALDAGSVPVGSAFTVTVNASTVSLAETNPVAVNGRTVTLTLAVAVVHSDTVTVSYSVPASNPVQDDDGDDAGDLTHHPVTNETRPGSDLGTIPPPFPPFTPASMADHTFGQDVTHEYSGQQSGTLDPGVHARTHVKFDDGTLEPTAGRAGINISNTDTDTEYHAISIGPDAQINVIDALAGNIRTENNQGNLQVLNRGNVAIERSGSGLRAVMQDSPGNILIVNYGQIELTGLAEPPDSMIPNLSLIVASINKKADPHDFTNYSHTLELFNMPGGKLIATGPYNDRVNGLKAETGSGHLTRMVNYATGLIRIEGEGARGISAQSLWGASQGHNFGTISINGWGSVGMHAGNCAPWPEPENGCHGGPEGLAEIIPNRTSNVPGDVYARNYSGASITTQATTRLDDSRKHRHGYGIVARNSNAGRVFAINEGTVSTEGRRSHGIYAYGYSNGRDLDDAAYPNLSDYPDTSDHDAVYAANTGTITTGGDRAHGILAEHHRGGDITVFNGGTIAATSQHSARAETTWTMGISVGAHGQDVPGPDCPTAAVTADDADGECATVNRVGEVIVSNTGNIKAPEGIEKAPNIGIDVVSEGGDVTITHSGQIDATDIGIRAKTSGEGTITLNLTGTLNAPIPYQLLGGSTNQVNVAGFAVTPISLTVTEGDTTGRTYAVVLTEEPTGSVEVTVSGWSGTDVTASPSSLTFNTANWSTAQTVKVTAADDADATDDTVTLAHAAAGGGYDSVALPSVAVTVDDDDVTAPAFAKATETRIVAENSPAGTNVGAPVAATGDATLVYGLEGADAAFFDIVAPSGQIQTSAALDYERKSSYAVRVKARDSNGSGTVEVTISVTDAGEPPSAPGPPSVSAIPGLANSLELAWSEPANTGPAVTRYDMQYREAGATAWIERGHSGSDRTALLSSLAPSTVYEVQVRATNDEGSGDWSASGTGRTNAPPAQVPGNWGLIPSGLAAGDRFRLLFVTSTGSNATSSDIDHYNTFLQDRAAAGHAEIRAYGSLFKALASTASVDARDNTETTYTDSAKGMPVYWLGGSQVAADYEDFYDGSWADETNARDESGEARTVTGSSTNYPISGSGHDGTEAFAGSVSRALGQEWVRVGRPGSSAAGHGPIGSGALTLNTNQRGLYGLSPVFEIGAASSGAAANGVDLSLSERSVREDASPMWVGVTVRLGQLAGEGGTPVTVSVAGGTAATGQDYRAVSAFEVWVPAGQTSGSGGFNLWPLDDNVAESDETVEVNATAEGLPGAKRELAIRDNDDLAASTVVKLTLDEARLVESPGRDFYVTVTGTLDGAALEEDVEVALRAADSGVAGEVGARVDHNLRLRVRAGQLSGTRTFPVGLDTSGVDQRDGTLTVSGTASYGLAVKAASLMLVDGDDPPDRITLTLSETKVPGGWRGKVWVNAAMTPTMRSEDTAVWVQVRGSGRAGAVEFEPVEDFALVIPPERSEYAVGFDLLTEWDEQKGPDETLSVRGTTDMAGVEIRTATLVLEDREGPGSAARVALWTDAPSYEAGQAVRVHRALETGGGPDEYELVHYRERIGTGERVYLEPGTGGGLLREAAARGSVAGPQLLEAAGRRLVWEGPAPEPGLWQFVAELREPGSSEAARRAYAKFAVTSKPPVVLGVGGRVEEIKQDTTWTSDTLYRLRAPVVVPPGATLRIEAGTVVQGLGPRAAIVVLPGGRIKAEGTREAPVVMTCDAPDGRREPGCWGGLALLGKAPVRGTGVLAGGLLPQARAAYGGADPGDSSGSLRHVRVEFAGGVPAGAGRGAALGLYGVGASTRIERVQAHGSLGDGLQLRGGSASCGYCVASDSGNAGVGWSQGWSGTLRHLYVQQGVAGGHGVEASGGGGPPAVPTLRHATVVGAGARPGRAGILLSGGATLRGRDLIVTGFAGAALWARGNAAGWLAAGASSLRGAILHANGAGGEQLRGGIEPHVEYETRDPWLRDVRYTVNPDPRPEAGSVALPPAAAGDRSPHRGAFSSEENWLEEWTFFGLPTQPGVPVLNFR